MERVHKTCVSVYTATMWTALKILAFLGLCYAAVIVRMYFSQQKMLYYPKKEMTASPGDIGLTHTDIWITNRLGTRIHGWWLPHGAPRFTLLFSHGNGGNISHRLDSLRIFHDLGLNVLVYDYSGYGKSQGVPGEAATQADARAAWDWLVQEQGVAPDSIILFGRSLGGAVTAGLAAELADTTTPPAGLIMESTFTSVPDMGAYMYPWLPVKFLAQYNYDSTANLARIQLPSLFLHSPDDDIVPFALGHKLYQDYHGPKSFLELSGDHNSGFLFSGKVYPEVLNRYLSSLEKDSD
nr:alpha/beta hydrolase [uncultured Pseudodesulfovibrio sp.]